jgi:hypothetical protein
MALNETYMDTSSTESTITMEIPLEMHVEMHVEIPYSTSMYNNLQTFYLKCDGIRMIQVTKSKIRINCAYVHDNSVRLVFTLRKSGRFVLLKQRESIRTTLFTDDEDNTFQETNPTTKIDDTLFCILCMENTTLLNIGCMHQFCADCILQTAAKCGKKCPCCRRKFKIKKELAPKYNIVLEKEIKLINETFNTEIDSLYVQIDDLIYKNKSMSRKFRSNTLQWSNFLKQSTDANILKSFHKLKKEIYGIADIIPDMIN